MDADLPARPRFLDAGNAGPFTLDGTRTFLVGTKSVAIIDPGPDVDSHVRALFVAVDGAEDVKVLLTHGHSDHAGGASTLAAALGVPVYGPEGVPQVTRLVRDGDVVETDEGPLTAVHTPGHTQEHLCFHWPQQRALFAGDLFLGRGDTTWVAEYPGCVADYLASLDVVRALELDVIYPAHGPALEDPADAIGRFEAHRRERIRQVEAAMRRLPGADVDELLDAVYGHELPSRVRGAARQSLGALMEYVNDSGTTHG